MLTRSDSAASSTLHRSKSTASVKERRKHPLSSDPPDPERDRVHALIAAHRAMDRSKSRSSGEIGRSDSSASRRTAPAVREGHIQFSPAIQLRRQRSALATRAPHLAAALRAPPPEPQVDLQYVRAESMEFRKLSENYGAEPSSYRRIRRSKSMLTPHRRFYSNPSSPQHTPFSQAPTLRNATSSAGLAEPRLKVRLKKSLSALRPARRLSITRRPETQIGYHDEAIQMARKQYLNDLQESTVRKRPSALFNPKLRRQHKAFRKSVRTSESRDAESSPASDHAAAEAPKSNGKRSFSATLRDRVMRAFGKSVSSKHTMPPQQIEASRPHFSNELDDDGANTSFDNYHAGDAEGYRKSFSVPSRAEMDAEDRDHFPSFDHAAGSRESLHSNARSRVTSWTNSTVTAGSFASRGTALERNRLSIIKEDGGPHQPSSSAGRHFGGIDSFQEPLETEDENGERLPPVDSQRVYSALMKRIGEEEVEIERTRAALDEISNAQNHNSCIYSSRATIRAVSNTTVNTVVGNDGDPHVQQENISPDEYESGMTPKMHRHNVERRKLQLESQEEQSSFFPFSAEEQAKTASPFRRLLQERHSQGMSDETTAGKTSEDDDATAPVGQTGFGKGSFGMSSESIYSRTTHGGENSAYMEPIGSSEDLAASAQEPVEVTGMATIIPVRRQRSSRSRTKPQSAGSTEKREWSGWMKDQMATLSRTDSKTSYHHRERAQIDPDDVQVGGGDPERQPSRGSAAKRFPLLDVKEVPRNNTPAPKRSPSLTKSQSGLLKRASSIALNSVLGQHDENRKASSGLRKVSPANIAKMLKERKNLTGTPRNDGKDKENSPSTKGESPPVSAPERLHLHVKSGNGRLRKSASQMAVNESQVTPNASSTPLQPKTTNHYDSPTDRIKLSLSARLSRPFNMDVPPENRPFDSIYLGKPEVGLPDARLSVAPNLGNSSRGPRGYGGLGSSPFESQETALPQVPEAGAVGEKMKGLWSSKRMVSDFLKRRRGERSTSEETERDRKDKEETPAFI